MVVSEGVSNVWDVRRRVAAVLAAPYARVLRRDEDGVSAEVLEFPGCYSAGPDGPSAWEGLEEAMGLWVESQLAQGEEIPPPLAAGRYQGRISLRVLPSVHARAALVAAAEGVSLNRWLSAAVESAVSAPSRPPPAQIHAGYSARPARYIAEDP